MTLDQSKKLVDKALKSEDVNEVRGIIELLTTGPERFYNVTEAIYSGITPEMYDAL